MTRINVYDGTDIVGWFDLESATAYSEGIRHDDHAHEISLATGSQWEHERLYRTSGGRWVLAEWSHRGEGEHWHRFVSAEDAQAWLIRNEYRNEDIEQATGQDFAPERGPGKPAIGTQVKATIPDQHLAMIDAMVERGEVRSRSEAVRLLVGRALDG